MKPSTNISKASQKLIGNFKTIEKTVASRHQRNMCYKITCCTSIIQGNDTYGSGMVVLTTNIAISKVPFLICMRVLCCDHIGVLV